jgi:uncharacterized protein
VNRKLYRWMVGRQPHTPGEWVKLTPGTGRRVLITGGTGFVGKPLVNALCRSGYHVTALTRDAARARAGLDERVRLIGGFDQLVAADVVDIVVNIAGESLSSGRWTARRKQRLLDSRIVTTRALHDALARLEHAPGVLINGSAIGFYGPQDDRELGEDAAPVASFSHELCARWEQEAQRFSALGMRVCTARFGVVLGRHGGALRELLKSYAFGTAVTLGSGRQWLSWIHLDDLIALVGYLIAREDLDGPFNLTSPVPVTNAEFARTLRAVVGAPIHVRMPAAALRVMVGEMADELLLNGQRVVPARLLAAGGSFRYPRLDDALRDLLT